jgi:Bacterial Ig-like domain (group 3)/YDG domain
MKYLKAFLLLAAILAGGAGMAGAVTVTPATDVTNFSCDAAQNGVTPAWTNLSPITIAEGTTTKGDFAPGNNVTLILTAPAGFQFRAGFGSVSPPGGDISASAITVAAGTITVTLTVSGTGNRDTLTISNIQVQATEGGNPSATGSILRTSANPGTASIAGIVNDSTSFGSLSASAGALRLFTVLAGQVLTASGTVSARGISGSPSAQTAGMVFTINELVASDREFNINTNYTGTKTISWAGPGGASLYTTTVTFSNGRSTTVLNTALTKAETVALSATDGSVPAVPSSLLTIVAGPASKLQVLLPGETTAPGTTTGKTGSPNSQTVGTAITSIIVNAVDAYWNTAPTATPNVQISGSDTLATISDDNGSSPGNLTLTNGSGVPASYIFNTAGGQTITASDAAGSLAANTSASVSVATRATTTSLNSSQNPSSLGDGIVFTASVSGGAGTPNGSVTFKEGASILGTTALNGARQAFLTNTFATAGTHSITAVYAGNGSYLSSTSSPLSQIVNKANTITTLASSVNPSVFGQTISLTATVAPAGQPGVVPTGTVTFKNGTNTIGSAALSGGQAVLSTGILATGTNSLAAFYAGDSNFNGSDNSAGPLSQVVNQAPTALTVSSSATPSVFGQPITFSAHVTVSSPGSGTPTGTVQFQIDGAAAGSAVTLSSGNATSSPVSSLSVGAHTVTAVYAGSSSFLGSDNIASPCTQTVNAASSTTTITSSSNPSVYGQSIQLSVTLSPVSPAAGTPTGTVILRDGVSPLATNLLTAGQALFTVSTFDATNHLLAADYTGDGNFSGSTSSVLTQTVNKASSTGTLNSSANPSVSGQSVTFTATVSAAAPGAGVPTGTIIFKDGTTALLTNSLLSGQASFTTAGLSVAGHSITAVYSGDASFKTNTSAALAQNVSRSDTGVSVNSSTNPAVYGQQLIFSAAVGPISPGAGVPTGTVVFKDGAAALTTNTLVSGQASYTNAALLAGSHNIIVMYNGDANFNTNSSLTLTQAIQHADTATTLISSTNTAVSGQQLIFTANVSALAPGAGVPNGSVILLDGAAPLSTNALASGQARFTNSSLTVGAHALSATYTSDPNFNTSTSAMLTQTVVKAATTALVASSFNPSVFGQPVTFTATIGAVAPGAGTPTGSVQFQIDGVGFGGPVTLSGGSAVSGNASFLATGTHTVTALYSGDGKFNASSNSAAPLTQTVNLAGTTATLLSSTNPAVSGQVVSFTANIAVVSPGQGTPTGTFTFKDGASTLGTSPVNSGQAVFNISSLSAGVHSITASYSGDGSFSNSLSSALSQTINQASTSVAMISSTNPSVFGQPVTLSVTVSVVSPGGGAPTGTVTFNDGSIALATNTLTAGQATLLTSSLPAGSHSLTAVYNGDLNFKTSTNTPLVQTVSKDSTVVTLLSSNNPSVFGQSAVFAANVVAAAPGSGTPSGTVTFKDGPTALSTNTLNGGLARYTNNAFTVAAHSLIAIYNGDGNFNTNNSFVLTQIVNQAGSVTTVSSTANPSVVGQPVSFVAAVAPTAPGAGTPSGQVILQMDGAPFSTNNLTSGSVTSSPISSLSIATHTVTAVYAGDSHFIASDNLSAPFSQTVNPGEVSVTLTSSTNPTVFGQSVTFSATVAAAPPASGTPSGTVTFMDGGVPLGTRSLNAGSASFSISSLAAGAHPITAAYNSDASFNSGSSTVITQTVNKAASSVTVFSSAPTSVSGQSVIFTATVSATAPGSGTPGGSVTFKDGSAVLGSATLSSGQASFTTSALTNGPHTIIASYGGDVSFNTSTSSGLTQTVNKASSTITLSSTANPSVFGQTVAFSASVGAVAPGSGTPTGTLQFKTNGVNFGAAVSLTAGGASSLSITSPPVGVPISLTATYSGDSGFNSSSSGTFVQSVNPADTSVTLTPSTNAPVFGQRVSFTAAVSVVSPGLGIPAGSVQFQIDGTNFGSPVTLSGGSAQSGTNSSLAADQHQISALFASSSTNFNGSTGVLTQAVAAASTITTVTSSANPACSGSSVTFTASVSAISPGAGVPSGNIQFLLNGTNYGSSLVLSNSTTVTAPLPLPAGIYMVSAVYAGDASFNGSSSLTLTQAVQCPLIPALGGTNISADSISGAATNLSGPVYQELAPGYAGPGTIVLQVPPGFAFDTGLPLPTVLLSGSASGTSNINHAISGTALALNSVTSTQLVFTISSTSSVPNILTWQNIKVRPTAGTPLAQGQLIKSGTASLVSVTNGVSSFGSLVEVPGRAIALVYTTQPAGATVGSPFGTQPALKTKDQFGNDSVRGLSASQPLTMSLALGGGRLQGGTNVDIGTAHGSGAVAFDDLGSDFAVTNEQLRASSPGLSDAVSLAFNVAPKVISAAITIADKVFDNNTNASLVVSNLALVGVLGTDDVQLVTTNAIAAFSDKNVGTNKPVQVSGLQLAGTDAHNYLLAQPLLLMGNILPASTEGLVKSSLNPAGPGTPVTFTNILAVLAPGAGTPTGLITFKDGATVLATTNIDAAGMAVFVTSALAHGSHTISAQYAGDGNFLGCTNSLIETINQPPVIGASPVVYQRESGATLTIATSDLLTNAVVSDPDDDPVSITGTGSPSQAGATVSFDGTNILYFPSSPDPNADDSFTFTVADIFGATAQGIIHVHVPTKPATPVMQQISVTTNGLIRIRFDAPSGSTYILQRAAELAGPWQDFVTNTVSTNGVFEALDANVSSPQQFYRARIP